MNPSPRGVSRRPRLSDARSELVRTLASRIDDLAPHRLRVALDGRTGAGKTSFAHELAAALRGRGRPTLRAGLDDFKHPWRDRHRYDRSSGEGYYRNAQDTDGVIDLMLQPAGADGDGDVVLCSIDPITQQDHRDVVIQAPRNAVLIVDGVFALRPEYAPFWDFSVWLDVEPGRALNRGVDRDTTRGGRFDTEELHRQRYAESEGIYVAEVDPLGSAVTVIDNNDLSAPFVIHAHA